MHPLIALAIGLLMAWAVRPAVAESEHQPEDHRLGLWRLAAGAAGALYPYADVLLHLLGPGAALQLGEGLLWAIPLLPFHAVIVAGVLRILSGKHFATLYLATLAAMAGTVGLALLTDDGIAPLALLWEGRIGLNVLYPFDALILGLATLTLMVGGIFYPFRHIIARMGLICITLYILSTAGFAWQARGIGFTHAEAHNIPTPTVTAIPQPLSPLNWRIVITDDNGLLHDTLINLKRTTAIKLPKEGATRAARIDALYQPVDKAEWRVYDRFGRAGEDSEEERTRVQRALTAWESTPFAWLSRYAVFDGILEKRISGKAAVCVKFVDIRFDGARDRDNGEYIVCPSAKQTGQARLLRPNADGDTYTELVPLASVSNM